MSWAIGYDSGWGRDIGYGVPAVCDHPDCNVSIDRGLSYVCGSEPCGGEHGCGLYFCSEHRQFTEVKGGCVELCARCADESSETWFDAKPDVLEWVRWKLTHESWAQLSQENAEAVEKLRRRLDV